MQLYPLMFLRSFKTRPVRTMLSMFGIILGVASILAIGITNQTALNSVTPLFAETSGKANLIITLSKRPRMVLPNATFAK